ncbi:MAG: hypothetical protein U0441_25195 [Polyangiaceae bacterium]
MVLRIGFVSSLFCALLAAGCGPSDGPGAGAATTSSAPPAPPTERWTEVTSDAAPLLVTMHEEFPPPEVLRRGELLRVGKSHGFSTWKGVVDDVEVTRDGMVFEAQHAKDGTVGFAFQSDLGGEVTITSTSWLCARLAKDLTLNTDACASNLHRARTVTGAILSYLPCGTGRCPVVLERGDEVGVLGVDGLSSAQLVSGKKASVLVAQTRAVKDEGKVTSGAVAILRFDGAAPVQDGSFEGDLTDARDPAHVTSKVVKVTASRGGVHLEGKIEVRSADGAIEKTTKIDELHALPPLD